MPFNKAAALPGNSDYYFLLKPQAVFLLRNVMLSLTQYVDDFLEAISEFPYVPQKL